jgi:proteic killer suppression protein
MIKTFRSRELAALWSTGKSRIDNRFHKRILIRLHVLDDAASLDQLDVPGYDFHALHGFKPMRYTIHVNGPWFITFEFEDGDAFRVDFEQYHRRLNGRFPSAVAPGVASEPPYRGDLAARRPRIRGVRAQGNRLKQQKGRLLKLVPYVAPLCPAGHLPRKGGRLPWPLWFRQSATLGNWRNHQ